LCYPPDAGYEVIAAPMVDPDVPWRHDAKELARQVMEFYHSHRGKDNE